MTKLIVILGFIVAFAAGLVMGVNMRARQVVPAAIGPTTRPFERGGPGMLTKELNLNPQQQEQMKQIWSDVGRRAHEQDDQRRQLREERDNSIAALIKPEDRAKFDDIKSKYQDQVAVMEKERRNGFESAVKQTKEMLTPEQREKYEAFLKRHQPPFERGGRERENRRGEDRATSRPASQP